MTLQSQPPLQSQKGHGPVIYPFPIKRRSFLALPHIQFPVVKSRKTEKKEPLSAQDPKKSPFETRKRKKRSARNVLGLLVSMTNGFVC